jgi:hypothetical protein
MQSRPKTRLRCVIAQAGSRVILTNAAQHRAEGLGAAGAPI